MFFEHFITDGEKPKSLGVRILETLPAGRKLDSEGRMLVTLIGRIDLIKGVNAKTYNFKQPVKCWSMIAKIQPKDRR